MKSIQHFVRQAFLYFAFGLICLGVICILIYSQLVYKTNLQKMEQKAFRVGSYMTTLLRNANNNILVAQSILQEQVAKKNIDSEFTGKTLASLINYNPAQYDIWIAIDKNVAQTLPNHPPGALFMVMKKPEVYLTISKQFLNQNFEIPLNMNDYLIKFYTHDVYYKDQSLSWYQEPIKNNGHVTYVSSYFDKIYTQEWVTTFSKAVYDKNKNLLGVVGIDFANRAVKGMLELIKGNNGLAIIESRNGNVIFDLPTKSASLFGNHDPHVVNINTALGSVEKLKQAVDSGRLIHGIINGKPVVYKAYSGLDSTWNYVVYQNIWTFYRSLVPFIIILTSAIGIFLGSILYILRQNKKIILEPIQDLLNLLKKDTLIIGSNKSFSVHYPESNVMEINELVACINTLIEVVNENFQNYRLELDKNIKSKEELEVLVHKRSEQLIEREKLAALGFMSAGLAHEIKNPLNLICNAAEIISLQLQRLDKANIPLDEVSNRALSRLLESNQIILNNGHRVDNIVKTLLLQVRSSKEGHEHLVDMGELIKTNLEFVLSNYRPKMNNRIHVSFTKPDEKIILRGHPVDLGRVFINLFDNSCYAMIKKINSDSNFMAELSIDLKLHENHLEVKIRDNGTGISKTNLAQVFTPFYTTKPPGEGTGLGLNFTYEIIKQHNGNFEINSAENEFTEAKINLPLKGAL